MNASSKWVKDEQFLTTSSSGHQMMLDGNHLVAPSPMEAVLMALCACTSVDVVSILKKKREPFTSLEVSAESKRATEAPKVFTEIKLIYTVRGNVTTKAVEDAVRLSKGKYCSVSAMLQGTVKVTTEIRLPDLGSQAAPAV